MLHPKNIVLMVMACALSTGVALAKLPPPSEEAKAKSDEAKAKAAHGDKVGAYKLCKTQDKVAERYLKDKGGKAPASACQDPGPMTAAASAPAAAAPATKK